MSDNTAGAQASTESDRADGVHKATQMVVEQAIFGDLAGEHDLIARSSGLAPLRALAGRTDLPDTPPGGTAWEAYESIFPMEEWLVVARTFPDLSAGRAGMVLTHALLLPLQHAMHLESLCLIEPLLLTTPEKPAGALKGSPVLLPSLTASRATTTASPRVAPDAGRAVALGRALLGSTRRPVIWIGQAGFWTAVCNLWPSLWPASRAAFSARLSFGPNDVHGQPLTLVSTPRHLGSRWPTGFLLVHPDGPAATPVSSAEALLAGSERDGALARLVADLGAGPDSIADLRLVEQALHYLQMTSRSADESRSLARLLAHVAPDVETGAAHKAVAVRDLVQATRTGTVADVEALANFSRAAVALPRSETVYSAISDWVVERSVPLTIEDAAVGDKVATLLSLAIAAVTPASHIGTSAPVPRRTEWQEAVADGATTLLTPTLSTQTAEAVWAWWSSAPILIESLGARIDGRDPTDVALAMATPTRIDPVVGGAVMRLAAARNWLRTHAAAASGTLLPSEAIRQHLAIDIRQEYEAAVHTLARRLPATALITAAVDMRDARLTRVAASAVLHDPQLLRSFDVERIGWRRVWRAALDAGLTPWMGIADRAAVTVALANVTRTAPDGDIDSLWSNLAGAPETDVTRYASRADLWPVLQPSTRAALLAETAVRWLRHVGNDPDGWVDPAGTVEPELAREIGAEDRLIQAAESWRTHHDGGVAAATAVWMRVGELTESHARACIARFGVHGRASDGTARRAGERIALLGWRHAAADLARLALAHRPDLLPGARACAALVSPFTRVRLTFASNHVVSDGESWSAFADIASRLYPQGPQHGAIWERAGGDPSELGMHGNGQQRWLDALRRLQHGGARTDATRLLAAMLEEYRQNEDLRWLANLPIFHTADRRG